MPDLATEIYALKTEQRLEKLSQWVNWIGLTADDDVGQAYAAMFTGAEQAITFVSDKTANICLDALEYAFKKAQKESWFDEMLDQASPEREKEYKKLLKEFPLA